ncbi:unnamed protein product, partial [Heterotrigona itama]
SQNSNEAFVREVQKLPRERRTKRTKRTTYSCDDCKYESNRQFNVQRHKERIHSKKKTNICCGESFFTKGDYYVHCERSHPATRSHAIISRTKYKIINDVVPMINDRNDRQSVNHSYNVRSRSRRFRVKDQVKAEVSLKYSVNCSEFDIEDIPLITFLTDRPLGEQLSSLPKLLAKASEKPSSRDNKQTVKIAISSGQNIEKTMSANNATANERVRTKVSSLSLELPTKKLILHRFRSSEFQAPLQQQSANIDRNGANLAEKTKEKKTAAATGKIKRQKQTGKFKRAVAIHAKDKENVFAFSMEQQLNIELNTKFELSASRLFEARRF